MLSVNDLSECLIAFPTFRPDSVFRPSTSIPGQVGCGLWLARSQLNDRLINGPKPVRVKDDQNLISPALGANKPVPVKDNQNLGCHYYTENFGHL